MGPSIVPGFKDGKHIQVICDALQRAYEKDNARLMIFLSPGSSKSVIGSILFPSWVFGKEPSWQILHISHTAEFTAKFGGKIRDLISTPEYQAIFPATAINESYEARHDWETTAKGVYRSAGVGGAIAGKRANIAIADDLVTEQTYNSKNEMEAIQDWWPQGFESRLLENGKMVLINTRWAVNDPAGWLLERAKTNPEIDQWDVVSIPAILDQEAAELLGLPEGESYWPEIWKTESLLKKKRGMPAAQWRALYMQQPVALDGNIIKTENFQNWKGKQAEVSSVITTLDTAFSTSDSADYSVIAVWGIFHSKGLEDSQGITSNLTNLVLIDIIRGRYEYPDLIQKCVEVRNQYNPDGWVIEKKASGQSLIQDLRRRGFYIYEYMPDKDKRTRAVACTPFIDQKRVYLPKDRIWAQDFIAECAAFAGKRGDRDDQVDCLSMAVNWMRDNYNLNYENEPTLEELEDERQGRLANKKYYWST